MSPEQIERAQKIARDWQPKSSKSFWNNFKGKLGLNQLGIFDEAWGEISLSFNQSTNPFRFE